MKAIEVHHFGGPDVLKLRDVPDPTPGPGQVLVDVAAAGVNPVDTYIRDGKYGPKTFPYTPGTDAAGTVAAVGDGATNVGVGDRVYLYGCQPGAYAERVVADAARVYPLPDRLSFAQGAAVGVPYATAYRAAFIRGQAKAGETVLVHGGTGGVGLAAVQLCRRAGLVVTATGGSTKGLDLLRAQGAAHAVDHRAPTAHADLLTLTHGTGFDLILEMLANVNLSTDLPLLARGGRVVVIGSRGTVTIDPRDTMSRDTDIRGMSLMHADEPELRAIHAELAAGFADGSLTPVIERSFPLAHAAAAHEAVMQAGSHGKIVLENITRASGN